MKNGTFIKIGNGNKSIIMAHPEKFEVTTLIDSFCVEHGLSASPFVDALGEFAVQVETKTRESINKKFAFWLKKSGWFCVSDSMKVVNLNVKR